MNTIIYITDIKEVVHIYKKTISISGGGADGIINLDSLEATLELIQNDLYYPTFIEKLTHLLSLRPIKAIVFKMEIKE